MGVKVRKKGSILSEIWNSLRVKALGASKGHPFLSITTCFKLLCIQCPKSETHTVPSL